MTLRQVKDAFYRSECGGMIRTGTGLSEPLPEPRGDGLADCFFIYKADRSANRYSGPLARFCIDAGRGVLLDAVSCAEQPFSIGPDQVFEGAVDRAARLTRYGEYEAAYDRARELFYRRDCSGADLDALRTYWEAFRRVVDPAFIPLYRELVPEFFDWLEGVLDREEG